MLGHRESMEKNESVRCCAFVVVSFILFILHHPIVESVLMCVCSMYATWMSLNLSQIGHWHVDASRVVIQRRKQICVSNWKIKKKLKLLQSGSGPVVLYEIRAKNIWSSRWDKFSRRQYEKKMRRWIHWPRKAVSVWHFPSEPDSDSVIFSYRLSRF